MEQAGQTLDFLQTGTNKVLLYASVNGADSSVQRCSEGCVGVWGGTQLWTLTSRRPEKPRETNIRQEAGFKMTFCKWERIPIQTFPHISLCAALREKLFSLEHFDQCKISKWDNKNIWLSMFIRDVMCIKCWLFRFEFYKAISDWYLMIFSLDRKCFQSISSRTYTT